MNIAILNGSGVIVRTEIIFDESYRPEEPWVEAEPDWLPGGKVANGTYTPPAPAASVSGYTNAVQALLDSTARERQYDSILSAITYRNDANAVFAAEAEALFSWRSAVWTYANEELAKVLAGERAQPTVAEFIDELPAMVWPA